MNILGVNSLSALILALEYFIKETKALAKMVDSWLEAKNEQDVSEIS